VTRQPRPSRTRRRASTLIEAVICVAVLGIAVPPMLEIITNAAADRADAVNTERAAIFAQSIMEAVIADAASRHDGLGFAALAQPGSYLDGFSQRNAAIATAHEQIGMDYAISISGPVDRTGTENTDESRNLYRVVRVTVTYRSADGPDYAMPVSMLIGDI